MLNEFNTNLLWLAVIYGKSKLVQYLIITWNANPQDIFKFNFADETHALNIIETTGLFADFVDQAKHKGWMKKDINPQICFDHLETVVFLAKKMRKLST